MLVTLCFLSVDALSCLSCHHTFLSTFKLRTKIKPSLGCYCQVFCNSSEKIIQSVRGVLWKCQSLQPPQPPPLASACDQHSHRYLLWTEAVSPTSLLSLSLMASPRVSRTVSVSSWLMRNMFTTWSSILDRFHMLTRAIWLCEVTEVQFQSSLVQGGGVLGLRGLLP